jgi:hypothetical protein
MMSLENQGVFKLTKKLTYHSLAAFVCDILLPITLQLFPAYRPDKTNSINYFNYLGLTI